MAVDLREDRKRIIIALDKPDAASALTLCDQLDPTLCRVKVGSELFTRAGPAIVDQLHERGFEIFLDLKFHDIPNTVAASSRAARELGVWMFNVHASGGGAMMAAARQAIGPAGAGVPLLIAVTVLTSFSDADLASIGVNTALDNQVRGLATLAQQAGLDGLVCSAREASALSLSHPQLLTVTPGIRMAGDASNDQQRIVTPAAAIDAGAGYLVVGRSISAAVDPAEALQKIAAEIQPAL